MHKLSTSQKKVYIYRVSWIGNQTIWAKFLIKFDPEYLVEEIKSRQHLIAETKAQGFFFEVFYTTPTIFQNVSNPSKILF